jgi:hypothetical protein
MTAIWPVLTSFPRVIKANNRDYRLSTLEESNNRAHLVARL